MSTITIEIERFTVEDFPYFLIGQLWFGIEFHFTKGMEYIEDYIIASELGRGTFGRVKLGMHCESKEKVSLLMNPSQELKVAIKIVNSLHFPLDAIFSEAKLSKLVSGHQAIVEFRKLITDPLSNSYFFITEYVDGCELQNVSKLQVLTKMLSMFLIKEV